MKIKHLLLVLLLAFCAPWSAKGQSLIYPEPLTVNDGTSWVSCVPFRSDCVGNNEGTNSQFIIPQANLTAMNGGTVSKLTFYSTEKDKDWGTARFSVYMAEVSYSLFTSANFVDWDSMSEVYTGPLSVDGNYMMEIVLNSPFTYNGGNLMVGFREIETGTNKNLSWKGVKFSLTTNPSVVSYCSTAYSTLYTKVYNYLPKMTIEYYVWDLPAVEVTEGDITSHTASFSWEAPSPDVTSYKYQYNKASDGFDDNWVELPVTATSVTLQGLDPVTDYFFRIKACYGELESAATVVSFKTECLDYAIIPYYENFDSYAVADAWKPNVRTLPDCWDYINTSTNVNDNKYPTMHHCSAFSYFSNSQPNSLYFYIDNHTPYMSPQPQYVILPAMQNINGLSMQLYARMVILDNSYTSTFKVGVMEETETGQEFVAIKTIVPTMQYQPYTIDFDSYDGTGEHIAIWMEVPNSYYGGVFIDNIEVEEMSMFTLPVAAHGEITGGWRLISSPLADVTHPENVAQLVAAEPTDFDLYRFNPNPLTPGMHWENWKSHANNDATYHFDFEPGKGYLYANAHDVILGFSGTPYSGSCEVTLQYNEDARFGGWNLLGNPYLEQAYIGNRAYYEMNEEGTGFVPAVTGSPIEPMEGIFVYTEDDGEVVTFSTTQTQSRGEQLSLSVSKTTRSGHNTVFDRAILCFNDSQKLPKFQFNEESAKVYIPQNGLDYAVVSAEGQGEMPVNFRADEDGTYTLSLSIENVEFSYLHLFDNKTGNDIDLLAPEHAEGPITYTFDATTTDYESRFKLVYATGSSIDGDSVTFLNSNGNFSIFGIEGEATLQVLDVMGRMLSTETFNGSIEKRLNVAPGVYFIRLVNGSDVKTQKIVVR